MVRQFGRARDVLMRMLTCLCFMASAASGDPIDTVAMLADCLSRGDRIDVIDASLQGLAAHDTKLRRADAEISMRLVTIRDTARVDAGAAATYAGYEVEREAVRAARRNVSETRRTLLEERRALISGYDLKCAGKSYTDEELDAARALLEAPEG